MDELCILRCFCNVSQLFRWLRGAGDKNKKIIFLVCPLKADYCTNIRRSIHFFLISALSPVSLNSPNEFEMVKWIVHRSLIRELAKHSSQVLAALHLFHVLNSHPQ